MPAEPAAVPTPNTIERFAGDTLRAKTERMIPKEPAAVPSPTSTPPPNEHGRRALRSPSAADPARRAAAECQHAPRTISVRQRAEDRLADAPCEVFVSPLPARTWCGSKPVSASMGSWKKPMADRGPNASNAMVQPHADDEPYRRTPDRRWSCCGGGYMKGTRGKTDRSANVAEQVTCRRRHKTGLWALHCIKGEFP